MAEAFLSLKLSDTHEWRMDDRRWWLHFLPQDDGHPLRPASRFEAELLNAAKREVDAARGATAPKARSAVSWTHTSAERPPREGFYRTREVYWGQARGPELQLWWNGHSWRTCSVGGFTFHGEREWCSNAGMNLTDWSEA